MYPPEFEFGNENMSPFKAPFLGLDIKISNKTYFRSCFHFPLLECRMSQECTS